MKALRVVLKQFAGKCMTEQGMTSVKEVSEIGRKQAKGSFEDTCRKKRSSMQSKHKPGCISSDNLDIGLYELQYSKTHNRVQMKSWHTMKKQMINCHLGMVTYAKYARFEKLFAAMKFADTKVRHVCAKRASVRAMGME